MRSLLIPAAIAAGLVASAASAQDAPPSATTATTAANPTIFKGFRVEGQIGLDRFHSQGGHDDSFGYGAVAGWDGQIGEKIVVGPYVSYWRGKGENFTTGTGGTGQVAHKTFQEYGVGVRAGYLVTPQLLAFGQGGYVNNEQRRAYSGVNAAGLGRFYDHVHTTGWQLGAGVEYAITPMFYTSANYRYSNYADNTRKQVLAVGGGVRF